MRRSTGKILMIACIALLASCQRSKRVEMTELPIASRLNEQELLNLVQGQTFQYFWEGCEPVSGCARERFHEDDKYPHQPKDIITIGGTGFGIMALIVGIERNFITRQQGLIRMEKVAQWLEKADRYHGAWSHWYMPDGKTVPFSQFDDGGDLVETAFLVQGLITARQYFQSGTPEEKRLAQKLDDLWKRVDWQWYTQGQDVLYWHWSPNYDFKMNFPVRGHNECLILYVLAAASPTHGIDPTVYQKGYKRDGGIYSDRTYYGLPTYLDHFETNDMAVGPLFWAHYSFLGLDPRNLKDEKVSYWEVNRNHALIHYLHCVENPYSYKGYSEKCWGLTSSYSMMGYAGHNPQNDLGVIAPTAALSSFPYTPVESMRFLHYLYEENTELIGNYGPYDAFSLQSSWYLPRYLSIDQLPIPVMIENYRTGLPWELFMSAPEVKNGLDVLGFNYK